MKSCDVFVLPSKTEGMSNSLLEAMAIGLPCIVSDIEQNRVLIESGVNGLSFPVGDSAKLSECIKSVKKSYGQKGRETFKNKFDLSVVKSEYERVLR